MCDSGEPDPKRLSECVEFNKRRIKVRNEDAKRYGVPLIISEFGACLNSTVCVNEIGIVTDACDEHLNGWAYWEFKKYKDLTTSAGTGSEGFYNNDGSLQDGKVRALARTYI